MQKLSEDYKNLSVNPKAEIIIDLQSFKHELKMTKTAKEICEYILSFDFIQALITKNNHEQKDLEFIDRNGEEYFKYL